MKIPVLTDLEKIEFIKKPKPEVQSGDAIVKVEYCGICGSDIHGYIHGKMIPIGTVMGHEFSGVVSSIAKDVKSVKPGDRVAVKPMPQCGECYWCKKGQYSICPGAIKSGIGINTENDGAFAEYVKIRYPKKMLFKIPDHVPFKNAALIEPLATSLHAVQISSVKKGDCVIIIGAGMIGLGVLQFLRLSGGAGDIIVLETSPKKSELAYEMGADLVLNPIDQTEDMEDRIFHRTKGIGADVVFECAGSPTAFQTCVNYVKSGGQVMVVGINDKDVPFNNFQMVVREIEMKGALGYYDEFNDVIAYMNQGDIQAEQMISDIISLNDLEEKGFKHLMNTNDMVKILVRP
jgi:(R,R)-butanediol dehydrogenase / meso-butanediol dehydrogenase / diacetyl reductase